MNQNSIDALKGIIKEVVQEVVQENMYHLVEAFQTKLDESVEKINGRPTPPTSKNPYLQENYSPSKYIEKKPVPPQQSAKSNQNKIKTNNSVLDSVLGETKPFAPGQGGF